MPVAKGQKTAKRGQMKRSFASGTERCPKCNQDKLKMEWYWWRTKNRNRVPDQSKMLVCSAMCRDCYRQDVKVRTWNREKLNDKSI